MKQPEGVAQIRRLRGDRFLRQDAHGMSVWQKAGSFNLDHVMEAVTGNVGRH